MTTNNEVFLNPSPTTMECDFCVVGGGLSGVCAALAAARNGASVILLQNRSVLGGNSSSEIRMHVVGANFGRPGARESGIIEELRLEDAVRNPQRSPSLWDLLLYEKVKSEPRIALFLDTECTGCETEESEGDRRITSLSAKRSSTEEVIEVRARFFADCSGDGRLGYEAGADYRMGREAQVEFGESLALPEADSKTLGSTILFMARRHEHPMPFHAPDWIRTFTKEDLQKRPLGELYDYCYWWVEWGGELDTIRDNETIRHELLRIALGIWDHIKNSGNHPNSANWALDWVGSIPGKRESRRFLGHHILTEDDVRSGRIFDDQVAFGGWPIDLHPVRGIDAAGEPPCTQLHLPSLYSIPLRALASRNVSNLLFAGRNISATHIAFASTRVMATCSVVGQAIGTAVAVGLNAGTPARTASDLWAAPTIGIIQQTLLKDDAFLLGLKNNDETDLARQAALTSSDSAPRFPVGNLTDGISRELKSGWGQWSEDAPHQWRSETLPAWIELQWAEAVVVREIHLTFDSGFDRILCLTFSESTNKNVIRAPQPELVKSYRIFADGEMLADESDNWLRKRVHKLGDARKIQTLRIELIATQGITEAGLFEVRVY